MALLPEEKMAARVLQKRGLQPPYNLTDLANNYGHLETKSLPGSVDGITVGIGKSNHPKILISSDISKTRQQFTLAHEIGHIVIPWHVGTVVSHLEPGDTNLEYKHMEMEANRFAAELLMPSAWIQSQFDNSDSVQECFVNVIGESGASKDAAFIKFLKQLHSPAILARVDQATDRILSFTKSATAPNLPDSDRIPKFKGLDYNFERFKFQGNSYVAWVFEGKKIGDTDPRPWRDILNEILDDTNLHNKLQSINAILATAFNKCKHQDISEINGAVLRSFSGRIEIKKFLQHPLYEQYIIKRVKELKSRNK